MAATTPLTQTHVRLTLKVAEAGKNPETMIYTYRHVKTGS
jgi:hypothetical protein